jgi:hypothetical protein
MTRWLPFAVALFMLTPFALWGGFWLAGIRGSGFNGLTSPEGTALLAASLPLAGLFWVQNLRQIGDSAGRASRLRLAARLAALLPLAIGGITAAGLWWLWQAGAGAAALAIVAVGGAAMAGFAIFGARAPAEPGASAPHPAPTPAEEARQTEALAWTLANLFLAVLLASLMWSPLAVVVAAALLVPLAFAAMLWLAHWGSREGA